jgi:hypothetical protein
MEGWEIDLITDGSELAAFCEKNGHRCSVAFTRTGATVFNQKIIGSDLGNQEPFCDVLSAWACGVELQSKPDVRFLRTRV